jgi:hypothetical protein
MAEAAPRRDLVGPEVGGRIATEVRSALRRKPVNEAEVAGALRVLAGYSPALGDLLAAVVETLVHRGALGRPLYLSLVRGVGELDHEAGAEPLTRALKADQAGGLATLSACSLYRGRGLAESLGRVAVSRHPHLAFAAQLAQLVRGESDGRGIASVAAKIKEQHRIALSNEVLWPLLWQRPLPAPVCPGLAVLRSGERHLGRWLLMGELAARTGDPEPLGEARRRATEGPESARAAWAMVAWVLEPSDQPPPAVKITLELVARLSDRPSADRDMTFLFRLAGQRARVARALLENFAKTPLLGNEIAVRSALYLARDHGRKDLLRPLADAAKSTRAESLRGLALAALFDAGAVSEAESLLNHSLPSKLSAKTAAWTALLRVHITGGVQGPVVSEPRFRRLQLGWVE